MWRCDDDLDRIISVDEAMQVLQFFKSNKAPGADRVSYELFKNAAIEFLNELSKTFNNILETGIIDEEFLESIIFPIHKKGDLNDPNNYRGISFMNCSAKVLMGVIHARLTNWIEKHNTQYSTVDNIYNLAAIVHLKFLEKKKIYAFFVDFKAAFDRVSRCSIIYKLHTLI